MTNYHDKYPLDTFKGEEKRELIILIQSLLDKQKAEILEVLNMYKCGGHKKLKEILERYEKNNKT